MRIINDIDLGKAATMGKTGFTLPLIRATQDTTTGADVLKQGLNSSLWSDFSGSKGSLLDKLGARVITDHAFTRWHITKIADGVFVDEQEDFSGIDTIFSYSKQGEVSMVIARTKMTRELLMNAGGDDFLNGVVKEEIAKSFDRVLFKKIMETAAAITEKTGFASGDADSAFTLANALNFESDLASYEGASLIWVCSTEVKEKLKQSPVVSGSDRFLFQFNQIADIPVISTKYFADDQTLILGDFSNFYVKVPPTIELLVDYVTDADSGLVQLTYSGNFGVGLIDENSMIVGKNIELL